MTVLEARLRIYDLFGQHSFLGITILKSLEEVTFEPRNLSVLILATEELEKAGICQSITVGKEKYWVLSRPLDMNSQTLEIDYSTAQIFGKTLNQALAIIGDKEYICDIGNITTIDIQRMTSIFTNLLQYYLDKQKTPDTVAES